MRQIIIIVLASVLVGCLLYFKFALLTMAHALGRIALLRPFDQTEAAAAAPVSFASLYDICELQKRFESHCDDQVGSVAQPSPPSSEKCCRVQETSVSANDFTCAQAHVRIPVELAAQPIDVIINNVTAALKASGAHKFPDVYVCASELYALSFHHRTIVNFFEPSRRIRALADEVLRRTVTAERSSRQQHGAVARLKGPSTQHVPLTTDDDGDLPPPYVAVHHRNMEGHCAAGARNAKLDNRTCAVRPAYAELMVRLARSKTPDTQQFQRPVPTLVATDGQHRRSLQEWLTVRDAVVMTDSKMREILRHDHVVIGGVTQHSTSRKKHTAAAPTTLSRGLTELDLVVTSMYLLERATFFVECSVSTFSKIIEMYRRGKKLPISPRLTDADAMRTPVNGGDHVPDV